MAVNIVLTPELLLQQSTEMGSIHSEYETLFKNVTASLDGINQSWSDNLSRNFSSKIQMVQRPFTSVSNMLSNGSTAASGVANRFLETGNVRLPDLNNAINDVINGGGASGKGGTAGGKTTSKGKKRNLSTADKAGEVAKHYEKKAADYRSQAAKALKNHDLKKAGSLYKKAMDASGEAAKSRAMQAVAIPGCMMGWDDKAKYESFGKAMENTPVVKDGFGMGKGFGMMAQGDVYNGIGQVGSSMPGAAGDAWNVGVGVGNVVEGNTSEGVDLIAGHIPYVKYGWNMAKGVAQTMSDNPGEGLDNFYSNIPGIDKITTSDGDSSGGIGISDIYKAGKALYYWEGYINEMKK